MAAASASTALPPGDTPAPASSAPRQAAKSIYRARYPVPCHRRSLLSRAACALCIPFLFLGPLNLFPAHIKTAHSSSIVSSPPTPFPVVGFLHRLALMLFADSFLASSKVSFPLISVVFPSRSSFLSAVYSFSFFLSLSPHVEVNG